VNPTLDLRCFLFGLSGSSVNLSDYSLLRGELAEGFDVRRVPDVVGGGGGVPEFVGGDLLVGTSVSLLRPSKKTK
jgi:hypothetical protein